MKPADILFLDIDGVLVIPECIGLGRNATRAPFHRRCVKALNAILAEVDCYVIISSSWRITLSRDELYERLRAEGVNLARERYWGTTPKGSDRTGCEGRGGEIAWTLQSLLRPIGTVVVLDDDYIGGEMEQYRVATTWEKGLTKEAMDEVIERFRSGDEEEEPPLHSRA